VLEAPVVAAPQLTSIHMLNELDGWGLTETAVVRTTDGGRTWYDLTPPGPTELGYAVGRDFLDTHNAWILVPDAQDFMHTGTLYHTRDGGLNWTSTLVPFGDGDPAFVDESNGWMLADIGVGAGSNAVEVHQTRDGGATWTQTYTNDPTAEGSGDSLPLGGLKFALIPADTRTAWVGGVVYAPGTVYLFRTDDGGANWQTVPLTLPEGTAEAELAFEDLQFPTAQNAFLTVRLTGANSQLAVYASDDGGATWRLTPTLIPQGGSVDFVSAREGVIWSGSQFYVTRDAAQTWTTVPPDVVFGDMFAQMDFVNADVGWVITYDSTARYNLYKTVDSGATWTPLFP
jgi:photosystem II stability/assembly factor-like uncharacterized protein